MFNFLDPKLLPKLIRKPMCTDNYEVENLISSKQLEKMKGFIAYPSVKPPVEIEFELLCSVNIFYIILNTSVGNQRCNGIEIFAKTTHSPYVSLGRAIYETQGVAFCNNRKYSGSNPPPGISTNHSLHFFKKGSHTSFLQASKVKIVIFKTEKSVPCMASAEIWGVPSKSCSQKTRETVQKLFHPKIPSLESNMLDKEDKDSFNIPRDFKDDLTFELMSIPYTLPSGNTIDLSTLEKHKESEVSLGRKPCDPFTGVKFTDNSKPILNVGLKSRIDMFLLKNSHRKETFQLKRSLVGLQNDNHKKFRTMLAEPGSSSGHSCSADNLDQLIEKSKKSDNFTCFTGDSGKSCRCIWCKKNFEYLYKLPCEHFYCRQCLLDMCKINCVCKECMKQFVKSEVIKVDF
ncbi:RING finger protein 37 [Anthonomus grandis grandis]|uniref:RING finger protein 37 n=1 Tax=Anthonomus grandis grandis TaxID=2921223 RepID=UPI002166325B|nr:RING finger protein 37 [Anthonomus grandis grandis]